MAKYVANPITVDAYEIISVGSEDNGERLLALLNGENVVATEEMLALITPVEGDYLVRQKDGYEYVTSKDIFKREYSLIEGHVS